MTRLLYIFPGLVPPGPDPKFDRFSFLSKIAEGEVLLPIWGKSPENAPPHLKATFPVYQVGSFRYHLMLAYRYPEALRSLAKLYFYVRRGLQLHREKKLDVIVTYGTNGPGIAGMILKWLTGAKLVPEIPGVPENAFRYEEPKPKRGAAFKRVLADGLLNLVGRNSDCIKLLYPWQLNAYPKLRGAKTAVFHDFVPVRAIANKLNGSTSDGKYVLLVGFPWYTKGVDVLIRAFKSIAQKFPDYKVKVLGHYPDKRYLDELAKGCSQIEFLRACSNDEAMKVFAACSVYVLASRTEAMGRVLLEAMAAQKSILASAVGGVPHYIADNGDGLLFESENVEELALKLSLLMNSPELRERLAKRGHERAMSEFDEASYLQSFQSMLRSLE